MKYLFILFLISFVIQQIYHWYFFSKFSFFRKRPKQFSDLPVSLVICGKNEAENFNEHLPKYINQSHQNYEIIVVDDHSTDNTADILERLQQEIPNFTFVSKENVTNRNGKKEALHAGVQAAQHDLIIVTDADCYPTSENWLRLMTQPFESETIDLVLGLAPNEQEYGFWRGLFRFETYFTALQYVSFAFRKLPYMGVGRNMAYRKRFFNQHFPDVLNGHLSSGDDDLLVNFGADPKHTAVVFDEDAFTLSPTPQQLNKWFRQKTRHFSAGFEYQFIHKFLLIAIPFSALTFFISGALLMSSKINVFVMLFFLWQYVTYSVIHSFGVRKFHSADLVLEAPFYYIIWMFIVPILSLLPKVKKTISWN